MGLTKPDQKGKPEYSAQELVGLYERDGKKIFHESLFRKMTTLNYLLEEKYPSDGIEEVVNHYFKDATLKEAVTDVLITAYEIERRDSFFFKSTHAKKQAKRNFLMKHIARATSAAPTYFQPEKIPTRDLSEYYALVDGGVFANNPSMCAYVEAKTMFPDEKLFLLVSLGTGEITHPIYYDRAKTWGLAQWAQPLLSVVFDGVADTVDYQLQQLLPVSKDGMRRYYRFQTILDEGNENFDNPDPMNLRALKLYAEGIIRDQTETLNLLCEQLVKP